MRGDVLIGVDPHKASNTLAVFDPVARTPVDGGRFANTKKGYDQLLAFARRWNDRRWAVEGCHGAGRSLSQRLVREGELVFDVPPKLAARVRVYSQGHGRKTDRDDAISIGLAALDGQGIYLVGLDDITVSLRLLCDRRDELTSLRTQAVCRLHRLLAELTPGGLRGELSARKAEEILLRVCPEGEVGQIRLQVALEHLGDVRALDQKLKESERQIAALVKTSGSTLTELFGVGPIIAGRVVAETGDVARFPDADHFASYNGTAPIEASSGDQVRHRLSRKGNRRLNHAIHMAAVTQVRQRHSAGRAYYERKRLENKSPKEALRCLKRRLSDVIFRQLVADRRATIGACGSPTTVEPTPPTSISPKSRSHRAARPSRSIHPKASKPSSSRTGRTASSSVSRSSTQPTTSIRTSSSKPRSSTEGH
jgi:transposase